MADRRSAWAVAVMAGLLLVLVAGACSGGGDGDEAKAQTTTTAGEQIDAARACGVVTKGEIEAAIGSRVNDGQSSGSGSTAACKYELAGTSQAVVVAISASTDPQDFQRAKAAMQGVQPVPAAGVDSFVTGNRAFVLKGSTLAIVAINIDRPAPALTEAAKKLAQAAAGRL